MTSRDFLNLQSFFDVIAEDEKLFHTVRKRGGLFASRLSNFIVDRCGTPIGTMPALVPGASTETYHLAKNVRFDPDGLFDKYGNCFASVIGPSSSACPAAESLPRSGTSITRPARTGCGTQLDRWRRRRGAAGMTVIFLDSGLRGRGEHSYQLLTTVKSALAIRDLSCEVYGCRVMDPDVAGEIGATPHFRDVLYDGPFLLESQLANRIGHTASRLFGNPEWWTEWCTARHLNTRYHDDLASLPDHVWQPGNIIVFPAVTQNQVVGISTFLNGRRGATGRIVCQLMMTPDWTPWGKAAHRGETLYARAFRRLARGRTVLNYKAENAMMADVYRLRFGLDVSLMPVPLGVARAKARRSGRVRIGYFGYSKTEKGFHLLPDAIRICQERGVEADYVVQVQHGGWETETVRAEAQLRQIAEVEIVMGELERDAYRVMIDAVDIALLPYNPSRFGVRGSGVFVEAVSAGQAVVASEGLFAAETIRSGLAVGEIFTPYTSAALATAIEALVARIDAARAQAADLAEPFARRHSGAAYVDAILG